MARQSDDALEVAWRALADATGDRTGDGWSTIPVNLAGRCRVLAGRRFQGGEEAVLIGFPAATTVTDTGNLPRGRGFLVELVREDIPGVSLTWIALVRRHAENMSMFARMADDIIDLLRQSESRDLPVFSLFTGRIRAWQAFMELGRDEVLGPSAETGLAGELRFLQELLDLGVEATVAVDGWRGPLDGLHDFVLGAGAIEVKASTASGEFPARVASLDQLDESLATPLFLAGVRLELQPSGRTLPQIATDVGKRLSGDPVVKAKFDDLVLHAGLLNSTRNRYVRRFHTAQTMIFRVDSEFPRLTRRSVPRAIREARYELDLDAVPVVDAGLRRVLEDLLVV